MDLLSTLDGSLMDGFLPRGWDLARIDALCDLPPGALADRQPWWHERFEPVACRSLADFDVMLGHEIATTIRRCRDDGRTSALILPVGPMGMYRWAVYFLKEWGVCCDHVHGFNMDEWSDRDGRTLPAADPGAVHERDARRPSTAPLAHCSGRAARHTDGSPRPDKLPRYADRIAELKRSRSCRTDGDLRHRCRVCHIAFWEPHFAAEYPDVAAWKAATHHLGAKLHPLTIEQNA